MANTKKTSAKRKLLPAVGMLAISATMLATSTYAWFTMSREVKVGGMEVRTKVAGNLLISDTNIDDSYYGTTLVQSRKALLEPVSTSTGIDGSFWYTVDAKADGSKLHANTGDNVYKQYNESATTAVANTVAGKTNYDPLFNRTYGQGSTTEGSEGTFTAANITLDDTSNPIRLGAAYGYLDYTFYLKATGDDTNTQINLTRCNLSYNDLAIPDGTTVGVDIDKAWRVAIFATTTAAETTNANPIAVGNRKGFLSLDGANYFTGQGAVTAAAGTYADMSSVVNADAVQIGTVSAGTTAYYKVTVRLWLEGQDTTCNSTTYAALDDDSWKLDLAFELTSEDPAIDEIGTAAPATLVDDVPDYVAP